MYISVILLLKIGFQYFVAMFLICLQWYWLTSEIQFWILGCFKAFEHVIFLNIRGAFEQHSQEQCFERGMSTSTPE